LMRRLNLINWKGFILVDEFNLAHWPEGILSGWWGTSSSLTGRNTFWLKRFSFLTEPKGFLLVKWERLPQKIIIKIKMKLGRRLSESTHTLEEGSQRTSADGCWELLAKKQESFFRVPIKKYLHLAS
jgi:hypothetical protein